MCTCYPQHLALSTLLVSGSAVVMETCNPPGFYVDPPAFDIELEEFGTLPMRRLEAVRLLRERQTTPAHVSEVSPAQKALTAGESCLATQAERPLRFSRQLCLQGIRLRVMLFVASSNKLPIS